MELDNFNISTVQPQLAGVHTVPAEGHDGVLGTVLRNLDLVAKDSTLDSVHSAVGHTFGHAASVILTGAV